MDEPKLQPPGAGLPWIARQYVRWIGRRELRWKYDWNSAAVAIEDRSAKLVALVGDREIQKRVLVPPQTGLEDSSRFWSAAMVFEHLNMTGEIFTSIILELSHGKAVTNRRGVADVKPHPEADREAIDRFRELHTGLGQRIHSQAGPNIEGPRFAHPWFGALTARDWLGLFASHLQIHEKQLVRILAGVPGPS